MAPFGENFSERSVEEQDKSFLCDVQYKDVRSCRGIKFESCMEMKMIWWHIVLCCLVAVSFHVCVWHSSEWYSGADTTAQRILSRLDYVSIRKNIVDGMITNNARVESFLEDPELYYGEETDNRMIWAAESTAPRDALLHPRIHAWIHVVVDGRRVQEFLSVFDVFVQHYASLGFTLERMLFDIHLPYGQRRDSLTSLMQSVEAIGADYRIQFLGKGGEDQQKMYVGSLVALDAVPLQDWIFSVQQDELLSFESGDITVDDFMESCERDGANSAMARYSCNSLGGSCQTKFVAFRGYLRANAAKSHVLSSEEAQSYFQSNAADETNSTDGFKFEYSYTPYYTWWEFYKSSTVIGNAYLWYPRNFDNLCTVNTLDTSTRINLTEHPITNENTIVRILASRSVVNKE